MSRDIITPHGHVSRVQVNRASHEGEYLVDVDNRPLNIRGRTGIRGRGVLGKWGPNHAADPVVTRQGQILLPFFQGVKTSLPKALDFHLSLRSGFCHRCFSGLFKVFISQLS